jgi:hypothetical protein
MAGARTGEALVEETSRGAEPSVLRWVGAAARQLAWLVVYRKVNCGQAKSVWYQWADNLQLRRGWLASASGDHARLRV